MTMLAPCASSTTYTCDTAVNVSVPTMATVALMVMMMHTRCTPSSIYTHGIAICVATEILVMVKVTSAVTGTGRKLAMI